MLFCLDMRDVSDASAIIASNQKSMKGTIVYLPRLEVDDFAVSNIMLSQRLSILITTSAVTMSLDFSNRTYLA